MLDTHALVWYIDDDPRLSPRALAAMERCIAAGRRVGVSAISLVELVYLTEKGRLDRDAITRVRQRYVTDSDIFTLMAVTSDTAAALERIPRNEVPDMPDRIIAATGLHLGVPLVSRDRKIRLSVLETIW